MSGPDTTVTTQVRPGRWRFATAVEIPVSEVSATSPTANHMVVELYIAGPVQATGPVQGTFFEASPTADPVRGWVARKDLAPLLPKAIPVPMLIDEYQDSAWYRPVGTVAFIGEPAPKDVRQGKVGDCKLLSALQALAASPGGQAHLKRIIATVDKEKGTFSVRLRTNLTKGAQDGGFEFIPVDNYFPVTRGAGEVLSALYGRTTKDTGTFPIWPALLEKAMAMVGGGYQTLVEIKPGTLPDSTIFATLGIEPLGSPNTMICTIKTGPAIKGFVVKQFSEGATFVAAAGFRPHNWAVIGADENYLHLADPYSPPGVYEREEAPTVVGENGIDVLWNRKLDKFPVRLEWNWVKDYVRVLTRFKTPPASTEGKDKEGD